MRRTARALSTAVATTAIVAVGLGTAASAAPPVEERARVPGQERATGPANESADIPADEAGPGPAWVPEVEPTDAPPIPDAEPSDEPSDEPTDLWAEDSADVSAEDSADASTRATADDWVGASTGTTADDWAGASVDKAPGTSPGASAIAPAAEVTPRTVAPGTTVTISVSCGALGGPAPKSIDAHSQAFEHGTAKLHLARGKDKAEAGPAYSGTARIAPAANFEKGGAGKAGHTSEWSVDGACPAPPGGKEAEWSATFTVSRDGSHHPHGVSAGQGGAFTDSPAALAAGGLLITGALGAAVHKLLRREPSANR